MMKLSSDETTAEIKMIAMNMPPGMPKPKPWKVMKVVSEALLGCRFRIAASVSLGSAALGGGADRRPEMCA